MKGDALAVTKRTSEQAPRVDRPPSTLRYATPVSLPATQGQRWADSWDLVLAVAARRSGINGCRYASDDGFDARPACFTEHDNSDSAIRGVLLIPEVRVGGEQHLEATGLRSPEKFPVAQRRPALFESGHYLVRAQVLSKRHRSALIKQNAHLRRSQSAPGRMVKYGLDLL